MMISLALILTITFNLILTIEGKLLWVHTIIDIYNFYTIVFVHSDLKTLIKFQSNLIFTITSNFILTIEGDVETIGFNPDAISILAEPVNNDIIWTDEKDMVGAYLPDKAKKNGKATGFRDIILENTVKMAFNRIMEKIRNPHLYEQFAQSWQITDPMPLSEKINMDKKEDLYE